MKPSEAVIRSSGARCHQYTEDKLLYFSIASDSGEDVTGPDQCLNAVIN